MQAVNYYIVVEKIKKSQESSGFNNRTTDTENSI